LENNQGRALIAQTAEGLNIVSRISSEVRDGILDESDGHPYVIKIVMGEIAKSQQNLKPKRTLPRREDLLASLFERRFANLSPMASRVFLTLCAWRSPAPQLDLEGVLLREQNEEVDPAAGVGELLRMSLTDRSTADDGSDFVEVPLSAAVFGLKETIEALAGLAALAQESRLDVFRLLVQAGAEGLPPAKSSNGSDCRRLRCLFI